MSKLEKFFEELKDEEFPAVVQRINVYMYDLLEAQQLKSGGGKVTREILSTIKKCMDHISLRLVKAHRDCVANEAKIKTMVTDSKAYEALIKRRSGASDISLDRPVDRLVKKRSAKKEGGYSLVVTPRESTTDVLTIKEDLKKVAKEETDFPTLTDVVSTKAGQLVIRVTSKQDSEKLKNAMETWADRVRVTAPKRRRNRMLLLSVEPDVEEEEVLKSLRGALQEGGIEVDSEVEIVKKFNTKAGKTNWIIDVDNDCFDYLIERRRICVSFERYRIVEYVQITRCFKCQAFGHVAFKCSSEEQVCAKCSGNHQTRDCTADSEICANCSKDDSILDSDHRADSVGCPIYQKYRESLLSRRL